MPPLRTDAPVTGLVLAAGGSSRLGRPKQLLPLGGATLLDATLASVRRCGFDQVVVALGGAADEVAATVDLTGVDVVLNPEYGSGCSSSIAAALPVVDPAAAGLVLLLGDQPAIAPGSVAALVSAGSGTDLAVCRYEDGMGHPFWLGRQTFGTLAGLHGDKGVWKLVDAAGDDLVAVDVAGPVPADVDTMADYEALRARWPR